MAYNSELAIDLDRVLANKFGGKKFPRFVVRFLERLLHIEFLNGLLVQGYEGQEFLDKAVEYLDVHPIVEGLENLDLSGNTKYTFASNHPLGGIDGVILSSAIGTAFGGKVRLQVNDFLMNLPGLASQSVPVSKTGSQSRNLPAQINALYSSDEQVLVFPAGLCSRRIDGKVQDLPWGKTFVAKSRQYGRYIVPIHFIGENSKRFYFIASLCKFLRLKFNFAMAFLPDEACRGMHRTYRAIVGKPIPPETFDKSRNDRQWGAWVREQVYKLG